MSPNHGTHLEDVPRVRFKSLSAWGFDRSKLAHEIGGFYSHHAGLELYQMFDAPRIEQMDLVIEPVEILTAPLDELPVN